MTPQRIQMTRQHGWRAANPDAIIVARPTAYGNPFRVGHRQTIRLRSGDPFELIITSPAKAVDAYRLWLLHDIDIPALERPSRTRITEELAGHDLACWCHRDNPCHADVLLDLANPETDP